MYTSGRRAAPRRARPQPAWSPGFNAADTEAALASLTQGLPGPSHAWLRLASSGLGWSKALCAATGLPSVPQSHHHMGRHVVHWVEQRCGLDSRLVAGLLGLQHQQPGAERSRCCRRWCWLEWLLALDPPLLAQASDTEGLTSTMRLGSSEVVTGLYCLNV